MRRLRRVPRHWVVPTTLAAALMAGLLISPAIGGPNFITKKKAVRTIAKKSNATQVVSSGQQPVAPGGERTILTVDLPQGNYLIRSTFSLVRDSGGVVTCRLKLLGVAQDTSTSFAGSPPVVDEEQSVAMETAGSLASDGQAQLTCISALPGTAVRYVEITAEKVPKLTVVGG